MIMYIDCFKEQVKDPEKLAVRVSDRHFGIGSDGLILIKPSNVADCEMEMYNADGFPRGDVWNGDSAVLENMFMTMV